MMPSVVLKKIDFIWAVGMKQYESGSVDATNLSFGEVFFFSQRLWIREWW